jgi:hypothetical protein
VVDIGEFWRGKLNGSFASVESRLPGWTTGGATAPGFVEPTLKVLMGDPEISKLFLVAAPGAVGKSTYANALASATQAVVVDLAKTAPLGGNFFTGGLSNAFGHSALADAATGKIALIVDALDEAQMRASPQGYEAGLLDLAAITKTVDALPAVLLGRAIAAEEAYLYLASNGFDACLLEIQFFDEDQAQTYIEKKLPLVAGRDPSLASAYATHTGTFRDLAHAARQKLIVAAGCDQSRFSGYAPVLDAICEFTLGADSRNPKAKLAELNSTSPIELIHDIITSIILREQGKLRAQFREHHPDASRSVLDALYTPDDQLGHVAAALFECQAPPPPALPNGAFQATYQEMVERFAPEHPFLLSARAASNPVFAAHLVAWALRCSDQADIVRRAVLTRPTMMSGIFFELYERAMRGTGHPQMPLADVGILYQALNSQIALGQRVQLEVMGQENGAAEPAVEVSFEILERIDPDTDEAPAGRTWGPFASTANTLLELRSPFSNIYIDAPIHVQLGDGIVQQIAAPAALSVEGLLLSAKQVLVVSGNPDESTDTPAVSLIATDCACENVQTVTVKDVSLTVSWPGAKAHPWNRYAVDVVPAADENVDFMRRRLRNILTAFRSHSKGALRRLAAKIDHSRMIKDERGAALRERLLADKILVSVQSGKFYELDPDIMGRIFCLNYHDLAQCRFTPELDSYLYDVLLKHGALRGEAAA